MLGLSVETQQDIVAVRNAARDTWISERTKEEQKFNTWYQNLLSLPQNVLDRIPFDYRSLSFKDIVSEWYKEVPDKEIASQQVKKINDIIKSVDNIMFELNKDAIAALEEYNALGARR